MHYDCLLSDSVPSVACLVNICEDLNCSISIQLNSPGQTWKMDINGPGKSWKTASSVLYAPSLLCRLNTLTAVNMLISIML